MHAVLHLQPYGPVSNQHQSLKQTLIQSRFGGVPTYHHRAQLQVIPHQYHLFGSLDHRQQTLGLDGLSGFVYQYVVEVEICKSAVCTRDAGAAHNLSLLDDVVLGLLSQLFELVLLFCAELSLFLHHAIELSQLLIVPLRHMLQFPVQGQLLHI